MLITTESGEIITTEGGTPIATDQGDTNSEIQSFDFSVDLLQAILWQYQSAESLISLVQSKQDWYNVNQAQFWQGWLVNVFNLATANEFGLAVWSIILDLPLFTSTSYNPDIPTFGFDGSLTGAVNFDNGILQDTNGSVYELPTETKRIALQLRYFQLVSSGTVPEANRVLAYVFGGLGRAWLIDNHDMTQTYIFNFPVTADLEYLFNNYDILPRPAGVASQWIDATLVYWGFAAGD